MYRSLPSAALLIACALYLPCVAHATPPVSAGEPSGQSASPSHSHSGSTRSGSTPAHSGSASHSGSSSHSGASHSGSSSHSGASHSDASAAASRSAASPSDAATSDGTPATAPVPPAPRADSERPPVLNPTNVSPDLGPSELARSGALSGPQSPGQASPGTTPHRRRHDPHEEPNETYWFLGASFQESFMPRGILQLFTQHAPPGIHLPRAQLELTRRRNNFDVVASLYWASYAFTGPFLGKNDTLDKMEMIQSNVQAFGASATMLWSTPFNDVVALEYGMSVGFGGMTGNVIRTEAYPSQGGPNTHDHWAACVGPTTPGQPGSAQPTDPFNQAAAPGQDVTTYCGVPNSGVSDGDVKSGQQYGVKARTMLHGGHVPFFSARLAPQLSLRIKPIDHFLMRIDTGFDFFSGVYVGGSMAYGF